MHVFVVDYKIFKMAANVGMTVPLINNRCQFAAGGQEIYMKNKGLYIQMFSIHGLVRSEHMELGYDADTGGQIKYVIELGRALSKCKQVRQVDLFTRQISDKSFSNDYSKSIEPVNDKFRLVRVKCGGGKYIRKELLWPHLDEFVDNTVRFIQQNRQVPDIVHGHYADAGYVARQLADIFGVPFVFTGHSLGRSKKARLLAQGTDESALNRRIKMDFRIHEEENILKSAHLVVASTRQETKEQYSAYRNSDQPEYAVIPPGIGIEKFVPYYREDIGTGDQTETAEFAKASMVKELNRFFQNPDKPLILMLCRPDKRKNIEGLVKAYGECPDLQAIANLAVFAGIRNDISKQEEGARDVLTQMLLLMDKYNLYGKMAIPKKHDFENEVPQLYRIAAERRGVFVNPALTEPFGITLLEASATGLPVVATSDGGPKDILENCQSGLLVDPGDNQAISRALKDILVHEEKWEEYSKNGIMNTRKYYTWESHSNRYAEKIKQLVKKIDPSEQQKSDGHLPVGIKLAGLPRLLVSDIDNTLLGGPKGDVKKLVDLLEKYKFKLGFAVATGRTFKSAVSVLEKNGVHIPDILITGVGSEIYYGPSLYRDKGWEAHISRSWDREKVVRVLEDIDFIHPQHKDVQQKFKLSYHMKPGKDRLAQIHNRLTRNRCSYNLIYSHEKYLDILPSRASKGKAIRYLSKKWEIPLKKMLVCGDSGNDKEMLKGKPKAVIVGNYSPELEDLRTGKNIYFAKNSFTAGVMEGMNYYGFI